MAKYPRTNTGNLTKKELKADDKPLPFSQPSQVKMATPMGHPTRNLGRFAHPPKGRHAEAQAPFPKGDVYNPQNNPDYKPSTAGKNNPHVAQKSVAGVDEGSSDIKSEGIGPDLGPLLGPSPADYKKKAPKKQMKASKMSGTPFFGGAM